VTAPALTTVILNWRTPELALRARSALIADGVAQEHIVLVDNASGDDSLAKFKERAVGSRVLGLTQNLGFARANNLAAREFPATECYLFVNSDAFVHVPGSVLALQAAVTCPGVGIAVPRLRNADLTLQPSVIALSSPLAELVRASGLSHLVPNELQPSVATHWDHSRSRRIQAAVGAVLAVSAPVWESVGGFDEQIFMYGEDHDLFRRIAVHGDEARFVSEAEFIHLGGASSGQAWGDAERAERVARSEAGQLRLHLPPLRAQITIGLMALGVGGRALVLRGAGRRQAAEVQLGWWRGYASELWRKRT
jgi:N-acetylglucosaminyl-diphospho-decaprenol L-rhamnosyltransferase